MRLEAEAKKAAEEEQEDWSQKDDAPADEPADEDKPPEDEGAEPPAEEQRPQSVEEPITVVLDGDSDDDF